MKSRRILAAVLAPVCALSATAVVASALEGSYSKTVTIPAKDDGGNGYNGVEGEDLWRDLFGILGEDATTDNVASVTVSVDTQDGAYIGFGYNSIEKGSWTELKPEEGEKSITFDLSDFADQYIKLGVDTFNKDVTATFNVTLKSDEETPSNSETTSDTSSDTPATSETTSDTTSDTPATSETTSDTTSDTPATSETTSDTSSETETPGTTDPGATDESTDTLTVEIKVPGKLEGDELNKAIFGDTDYTWADVENAKFMGNSSADLFSVQFSTFDGGWYTKGIDTLPTRADEAKWNTEWELTAEDLAAFDTTKNGGGYVKLVNQDEETEFTVTAEITIKKKAADDPTNPSTGIALAIAPVVLAGAAAVVVAVNKKRK